MIRKANIAVLSGDGVGPEVMREACRVLSVAAESRGRSLEYHEGLIGGVAIDRKQTALPQETIELCQASDGVLLGAVGGPQWDDPSAAVRPEQGLLGIRKALGLFANLRPVRVFPVLVDAGPLKGELVEGVDMLVVRELTGGIYFGAAGTEKGPDGERAFSTMVYNTKEIERVVRVAGIAARGRRKRLVSVDKANVLEVSRLWRRTADAVLRSEFKDIEYEHILVDAAAMYLVQKPAYFDVIVTGNMFGDILTDESSVLAGSMGMLPSASLGESGPGLYEPIHGSGPDIAGKGIANPVAMILSAAMMCRESLGWADVADRMEAAVARAIAEGARTVDIAGAGESGLSTEEMGERIASCL